MSRLARAIAARSVRNISDVRRAGSRTHALKWRYMKDYGASGGSDCGWVDYVQWTPDDPPLPTYWETITYTYDPSGRRIAKAYDGVTVVKWVYDGPSLIAEYDGYDNLLRKYIYGPGINEPICMIDVEEDDAVYYYHFDGLGSVVALSDEAGDTDGLCEHNYFGGGHRRFGARLWGLAVSA